MISSNDCKAAIVAYLKTKPGYVAAQFVDAPTKEDVAAFESYAHLEKNWKRFEKENQKDGLIRRGFDCKPLLFVPVHVVSFVLAVVMAPFVWILYGEVDRHCAKFTGPAHGYYTTGPLLSGTNVLFYDDDVYRDVRLGKRTKYVYSGGCAY